jgi:hypothetical protein
VAAEVEKDENIVLAAVLDLNGPNLFAASRECGYKTEAEARQLAQIQGSSQPVDESFPLPYNYRPPTSWTDEDE